MSGILPSSAPYPRISIMATLIGQDMPGSGKNMKTISKIAVLSIYIKTSVRLMHLTSRIVTGEKLLQQLVIDLVAHAPKHRYTPNAQNARRTHSLQACIYTSQLGMQAHPAIVFCCCCCDTNCLYALSRLILSSLQVSIIYSLSVFLSLRDSCLSIPVKNALPRCFLFQKVLQLL